MPTRFLVWWPELGDTRENAVDAELSCTEVNGVAPHMLAAERMAQQVVAHRYDRLGGRTPRVQLVAVQEVNRDGSAFGRERTFRVNRELVPRYYAFEVNN